MPEATGSLTPESVHSPPVGRVATELSTALTRPTRDGGRSSAHAGEPARANNKTNHGTKVRAQVIERG
jgi:hypothetical protein